MIKSYKVKLKLNNKQKTILVNNANVARFIYNLTLDIASINLKHYPESIGNVKPLEILASKVISLN